MKQITKFLLLVVFFAALSCDSEGGQECFTPPTLFEFQFIDKASGENLFTNGTYTAQQIKIKDLKSDKVVTFDFIDENNYNTLRIDDIGWKTEVVNYAISFDDKEIFELAVDAKRINEGCSHTEYNNIEIKNTEFELDKTNGIYKILIGN